MNTPDLLGRAVRYRGVVYVVGIVGHDPSPTGPVPMVVMTSADRTTKRLRGDFASQLEVVS